MINVTSTRNCVSTSHFAAATCHYCTITVCTTIVASRTSFGDLSILFRDRSRLFRKVNFFIVTLIYLRRAWIVAEKLITVMRSMEDRVRIKINLLPASSSLRSLFCFDPTRNRLLLLYNNEEKSIRWNGWKEKKKRKPRISCAREHYTLNPIILADYWLDSVCSLCRWSRLTLSLPCLVRLHIYIINYITLLIIIFTPSRSHAYVHARGTTHTQTHTCTLYFRPHLDTDTRHHDARSDTHSRDLKKEKGKIKRK